MTINSKIEKIYLAAPWFDPGQAERYDSVLGVLREWESKTPGASLYVPREHPCPAVSDARTRREVYAANIRNLEDAGAVVAITDGKDLGTIYELGYAARLRDERREVPSDPRPLLLGVALTLGDRPFNLRLAVGLDLTFRSVEEIRGFLLLGNLPPEYRGEIE